MNFGQALESLKDGKKVSRDGWNAKGLWIELQTPTETSKMTRPYIYMTCPKGSTNHFGVQERDFELVPWLPSQTDILAEDWCIVTEPVLSDDEMSALIREEFGYLTTKYPRTEAGYVETGDRGVIERIDVHKYVNGNLTKEGETLEICHSFYEAMAKTKAAITYIESVYKHIWFRLYPELIVSQGRFQEPVYYIRFRVAHTNKGGVV